jgi:hypothetical protein
MIGNHYFFASMLGLLVTAKVLPSSPILVTLLMGGDTFLQIVSSYKTHDVTSQKTQFFIVTAVKT